MYPLLAMEVDTNFLKGKMDMGHRIDLDYFPMKSPNSFAKPEDSSLGHSRLVPDGRHFDWLDTYERQQALKELQLVLATAQKSRRTHIIVSSSHKTIDSY